MLFAVIFLLMGLRSLEAQCPVNPGHQVMVDAVDKQQEDKILVFVSASMPTESLKRLRDEAVRYQAVLVMRGLVDDSFRKTMAFLKDVGGAEGIQINPHLFEDYGITQVPVFVRLHQGREVHRLSGNVTLGFAAAKLKEAS